MSPLVALGVAQAGDFHAHKGAIGDVVVTQSGGSGIAGEVGVPVEQQLAEFARAEPLEVHGQEGHVIQPVEPAQVVVELQAVKDAGAVVEAEDVVGEQVTVAVDHPAGCHPAIEQCLASRKELVGELFDLGCHLGLEHGTMERADLIETVSPPGADRVAGAVGGDF